MALPTKQEIFDLFYEVKEVQNGGRDKKKKMAHRNPSFEAKTTMIQLINGDEKLLEYYNNLLNRDAKKGIPPRPTS